MYCIGLTGFMGSGKSTAAAYFATLGVTVIHADNIAKELTSSGQPAFQNIVDHFGKTILSSKHEINRSLLRQLVFNKEADRIWLEQLLHPLIRQKIEKKIANVNGPYCVIEIPLLSNKSNYPYLDRVLLIQAEPTQQIARSIARDKSSKETVLAILDAQKKYHQLQFEPDDIIMNTGTPEELHHKIDALHKKYIYYANN